VEVRALHHRVADEAELASLIGECEVVVIMRERTPFTRRSSRGSGSAAARHERHAKRGDRSCCRARTWRDGVWN
jgi:hypothetical protein